MIGWRKERTLEIFCNFLVPHCDVCFAIVDERPQQGIVAEVGHEDTHALDALNEVEDELLGRLFVEGAGGVLDGLSEDGGEANAHGCMGERVLMVTAISGPRGIIWVDLGCVH
jgi:hypothetical protein